jgi:hypothetical protein
MLIVARWTLLRTGRELRAGVHSKCRHMTVTRATKHNPESSANRTEACRLIYI